MRELPDYQEKVREQPYCYPYCVKARVLMYAHLARANLPENTLEKGNNQALVKLFKSIFFGYRQKCHHQKVSILAERNG